MKRPAPKLLGGPYQTPYFRRGQVIVDESDRTLKVCGMRDSPIPWPVGTRVIRGGRSIPLLVGDLVKAVRVESVQTVCYYWGVSMSTVTEWRHALDVPRFNRGTYSLWLRPRGPYKKKGSGDVANDER